MLAQATPSNTADPAAWGAYIAALRGSMQESWAGARGAYLTLKNVRAQLGMPFIAPPVGEGGVPDNGAWSDSLEDNMLDLQAMVKVTDDAFGDVLAQKRKLLYDAASNDWAVEGLPGDLVRVKLNQAGQLSLADATNQPIHVGGTIGLAPLLIVAGVAAAAVSGAVTFVAAAIVIKKTCETIQAIAEEKTLQTALKTQAELVQSGKATPEQAAAMTKAVYDGAAQVNESKAKVEAEKSKSTDKLGDTIKTVAYVGLGVGVIYLLAKFIPSKSAALEENPISKSSPLSRARYTMMELESRGLAKQYGLTIPEASEVYRYGIMHPSYWDKLYAWRNKHGVAHNSPLARGMMLDVVRGKDKFLENPKRLKGPSKSWFAKQQFGVLRFGTSPTKHRKKSSKRRGRA